MENIGLNSLFYFWEIAKAGSLKQAAIKLHLTQPTLSHQLKSLETSLGTKLFDRVGKRLQLNKNGELVQQYCHKIFGQLSELQNLIDLNLNKATDHLAIGIIPSMPKVIVYRFIAPYLADKSVKITVKEDNLKYLLNELESGELDIIFTDDHLHHLSKSIVQQNIYSQSFSAVCHPKCELQYKTFPKNLSGLRFINYTHDSILHDKIAHYLRKNEIALQSFYQVDDTSLIKEILIHQEFAAILPSLAVNREIKEKKLKRLGIISEIKNDIYVLIHDDNSSKVIKKFRNLYAIE